jgi:hypothetical protein
VCVGDEERPFTRTTHWQMAEGSDQHNDAKTPYISAAYNASPKTTAVTTPWIHIAIHRLWFSEKTANKRIISPRSILFGISFCSLRCQLSITCNWLCSTNSSSGLFNLYLQLSVNWSF